MKKEFEPEDCQGCGTVINNAEGGYCNECLKDIYSDMKENEIYYAS